MLQVRPDRVQARRPCRCLGRLVPAALVGHGPIHHIVVERLVSLCIHLSRHGWGRGELLEEGRGGGGDGGGTRAWDLGKKNKKVRAPVHRSASAVCFFVLSNQEQRLRN